MRGWPPTRVWRWRRASEGKGRAAGAERARAAICLCFKIKLSDGRKSSKGCADCGDGTSRQGSAWRAQRKQRQPAAKHAVL